MLAGLVLAALGALPASALGARGRGRASPPTSGALPPIVFVSRGPVTGPDGERLRGAIPGVGPRDRAAAVGGRLLVREPDGSVRALVDETAFFDVADPCVSWDATRVLFSGLVHPDSSWRIFEVRADGSGLRQVTHADRNVPLSSLGTAAARFARYDDLDPCWLPNGRIAFASTRFPSISQLGDHLATNIFVVEADGSCLHRITTDRSGAEEPAVDPVTGRLVYSRWWLNTDRPSNVTRDGITTLDHQALTEDVANIWQTVSVRPDGGGVRLHAGDPRSREGSVCYKPALLEDGRVLAMCAANGSFSPAPGGTGVRLFAPGAHSGLHVLGVRPRPRAGGAASAAHVASQDPAPPPYAADPAPIPGGRILVAVAPDTAEDYGLAVCDLDGTGFATLLDWPGTQELDPAPLVARPTPPVLPEEFEPENFDLPPTEDPTTYAGRVVTFRFDCPNVFFNAPVDAPIPDAPPITRNVRIRFFTNFQRQNPSGRDPAILYTVSDLSPRGAVHEHDIPAEVPLFEQLVDGEGRVIVGRNGKAAHVAGLNFARFGEGTKCMGCHAGHSVLEAPKNNSAAEWFNVSTSAAVRASSEWLPEGAAGPPCPAERLVDRRARNDSLEVAWVAAGTKGEGAVLSWPIPVEVRRFVLYGIRPNPDAGTDLRVESCRITLFRSGRITRRIADTGRVLPGGTDIELPPTEVDSAQVEILRATGRVARRRVVGLAELETIARLTEQ